MKRLRVDRWANQLQPPRNPRLALKTSAPRVLQQQTCSYSHTIAKGTPAITLCPYSQTNSQLRPHRKFGNSHRSISSDVSPEIDVDDFHVGTGIGAEGFRVDEPLNFPSYTQATSSARLSALHARLQLPAKLPVQTLARCLVDPSVDPRPGYNNAPLALIGQDLLGYATSEYVICHYPRLPMAILFAAQYAYVGPATLAALREEWGVDVVAAPGPEVDPGLLQLKRMAPGNAIAPDGRSRLKDIPGAKELSTGRPNEDFHYRRGMSSRIVYDDQFGDLQTNFASPEEGEPFAGAPTSQRAENPDESSESPSVAFTTPPVPVETNPTTVLDASAGFVRALVGALYLHAGAQAARSFHAAHVLSRKVELDKLFYFTMPTRDLSRLCAREGMQPPVCRLISETGRLSRHPVFVVGVYSGNDLLGEGAGASLNEARIRAAAAAMRSWYLYSPLPEEVVLPSEVEGSGKRKAWKAQLVDPGEVVT